MRPKNILCIQLRGLALLMSGAVCFSGCATISSSGLHQTILVQSEPPGAEILVDGKPVEQTPAYVTLRRGRHPEIAVRDDDGATAMPLKSHYRWAGSFAWNLLLYVAAPVGWAVDLMTGAAWEADDPPPMAVHLHHPMMPAAWIAIAPPQTKAPAVSDAGGVAIEQTLRAANAQALIRPFLGTQAIFLAHDYDYDGRPPLDRRRDLYAALDVRTLYESTAEYTDDNIVLHVKKTGVYDGTSADAFSLKLRPDGEFESVFTSQHWWARLIPNTPGLTFSEDKISVNSGNQSYPLTAAGDKNWIDAGFTYLSAIDLTNTLPRRAGRSGRWAFGFVPKLRVSRQVVLATGLPDQGNGTNETFTRWRVETGYGPEVGYQFGRHYFYLQFSPYMYWNEISWDANDQDHSVTNMGFAIGTETGYIANFGDHFVLRLFTRSDDEDTKGWVQALHDRLPDADSSSVRAQIAVVGFSIGYRIEPEFSSHRWMRE